jgi:hypothetical protein
VEQSATHGYVDSCQDVYEASTLSYRDKDRAIEYIKGQAEQSRQGSFVDEYWHILREHGIGFDERYLV